MKSLLHAQRHQPNYINNCRQIAVALSKRALTAIAFTIIFGPLAVQFAAAQIVNRLTFPSQKGICNYYLAHNKTNATVGWPQLTPGSGTKDRIGSTSGVGLSKNQMNSGQAPGLNLLAGVMSLTSIPFIISAGHNRKIAFLTLKREKIATGDRGTNNFHYLAIDFKINF